MTFGTVFTVIVALLAPIGAGIWIAVRHRTYTRALLFGVLTFTVFQILLRIPLLQYVLPKMDWFLIMTSVMPAFTAAFYGVTASLFEEFGRWIVMKLALKQHTSYFDGIAFGVGHGGIEAILLVGINALVLLFYPSALLSSASMFAGGLERIFTIVCHVAWSVMVIKSIREKKPLWLILPLILHAALDTGALLASMAGATVWIIELALAIFAALMLAWLIFEYKKERNSTHETYEEIH